VADTATEIEDDVLVRAIEDFWGSMLGLDIARVDAPYGTPGARETVGTVSIMGGYSAAVVVRLPEDLARQATAAMFGMEPDECSNEEVGDAIGEVANVVAGALKGTLDTDCRLSLPGVTEGTDLRVGVPGGVMRTEVRFDSDGHRFAVQLWVRDE
jgi:chemotaxis protein CheX